MDGEKIQIKSEKIDLEELILPTAKEKDGPKMNAKEQIEINIQDVKNGSKAILKLCKKSAARKMKARNHSKVSKTNETVDTSTNRIHEEIRFVCSFCSLEFRAKKHMLIHVAAVHEKVKQFKCNECGKEFTSKSNGQRHLEIVHEGKRPYTCNLCMQTSSTSGNLKAHIGAVQG